MRMARPIDSNGFYSNNSSSTRSRRSLMSAASDSFRKGLHKAVSVELQLEKLEGLLCETCTDYCQNSALVAQVKERFSGLAERKHYSIGELSHSELGEIVETLKWILTESPNLPPHLVAETHSTIGQVRQLRGEYGHAITSFVKALWLAVSVNDPDTTAVGLLLHRLGLARGRNNEYTEATTLLERALVIYKQGLGESHSYVMCVQNDICAMRLKLEQDLWHAQSGGHQSLTVHREHVLDLVDRRLSS